jgi:ABC-type antimicrobial peptide transport system permease subunit
MGTCDPLTRRAMAELDGPIIRDLLRRHFDSGGISDYAIRRSLKDPPLRDFPREGAVAGTSEMAANYLTLVIRQVMLRAALPEILVGMRIAIGFGWTTLVAAEMVAANVGLGQMVLNASNFLRTDIVVMGIVVIGVVAYLFDLLMRWAERRLVPWKGKG